MDELEVLRRQKRSAEVNLAVIQALQDRDRDAELAAELVKAETRLETITAEIQSKQPRGDIK